MMCRWRLVFDRTMSSVSQLHVSGTFSSLMTARWTAECVPEMKLIWVSSAEQSRRKKSPSPEYNNEKTATLLCLSFVLMLWHSECSATSYDDRSMMMMQTALSCTCNHCHHAVRRTQGKKQEKKKKKCKRSDCTQFLSLFNA